MTNMKSKQLMIAVAFCCATAAVAQTTPTTTPTTTPQDKGASHECLMNADAQAWSSLGLTSDQTRRVQEIQAQCKKECEGMKGSADKDHMRTMSDKHDAQIKAVLSPDQYSKWVAWCGTQGMKNKGTNPDMK